MTRDPVCNLEFDEDFEPVQTDYAGDTYYFCSEQCKRTFEAHPELYVPRAVTSRI